MRHSQPGWGKMLVTPACQSLLLPLLVLVTSSNPATEPALICARRLPCLGLVQLSSLVREPAQTDGSTELHQMVSVW